MLEKRLDRTAKHLVCMLARQACASLSSAGMCFSVFSWLNFGALGLSKTENNVISKYELHRLIVLGIFFKLVDKS